MRLKRLVEESWESYRKIGHRQERSKLWRLRESKCDSSIKLVSKIPNSTAVEIHLFWNELTSSTVFADSFLLWNYSTVLRDQRTDFK